MADITEVKIDDLNIKRLSDEAIERTVQENRNKFSSELITIDKSDLDRHVYEGGLKVWECAYDLAKHIRTIELNGKSVLELGCGAALPSIVAIKNDASKVISQDYNLSVIELVTRPNFALNDIDESKFQTIASSWENFSKSCEEKVDIILTSETIYDSEDYESLHDAMNAALKDDGIIILAAKIVYFGKKGDYFSFMDFVDSKKIFKLIKTEQIEASVPRIIVHLQRNI